MRIVSFLTAAIIAVIIMCALTCRPAHAEIDPNFRGLPAEVVQKIKAHCAQEWPDDFSMQAYCAMLQVQGWRALHDQDSK